MSYFLGCNVGDSQISDYITGSKNYGQPTHQCQNDDKKSMDKSLTIQEGRYSREAYL